MENEKRRMQGVWNPSVSRTAHIKKMPGSAGCFDIRKQFCVQLWSANTAPWMHPRQSRVASFLDWDHKALPIEDTTKAPSPDEAFYFQISINALFPAAGEPLLFYFFAQTLCPTFVISLRPIMLSAAPCLSVSGCLLLPENISF